MKQSRASVRVFLLGVGICLLVAAPSRADFVISGGSATVAPGGTATVDFTITSNSLSGDDLNTFNLELLITVSSGTSFLQFSSSISQPDFSNDPNYVFSGNSGIGPAFWGAPSTTVTANDTISGGDFYTGSPPDVTITSSTTYLLAQVQVQADSNASAGDSFQISLVPDPNQTYFQNSDQVMNGGATAYTSTPATVTVEEANTVAGPPSLVLAGTAALGAALSYWRSRRKALLTPRP